MKELIQARLKELLRYEPRTGLFTWLVRRSQKALVGQQAGRVNMTTGYVEIQIDGRRYKAHRLAWLYVYGYFPDHQIDHIKENKTDNRIKMLRVATRSQNKMNVGITNANNSGIKGVYRHGNRWIAQAQIDGKKYRLGSYKDKHEAGRIYDSFCLIKYGEFYHPGSQSNENVSQ